MESFRSFCVSSRHVQDYTAALTAWLSTDRQSWGDPSMEKTMTAQRGMGAATAGPVGGQVRFWGVIALLLLLVLWLLWDVLLPFLLGAILAYLLDPLADRLERAGLRAGFKTRR